MNALMGGRRELGARRRRDCPGRTIQSSRTGQPGGEKQAGRQLGLPSCKLGRRECRHHSVDRPATDCLTVELDEIGFPYRVIFIRRLLEKLRGLRREGGGYFGLFESPVSLVGRYADKRDWEVGQVYPREVGDTGNSEPQLDWRQIKEADVWYR
ncbi:unnamed protein product [Protopolystoma xenopodis]|uniref:Uncharacterized protein n=1 Tax=Protopolystoma xenopodis TaxID=117903 RepID=A0A448WBT4_9PLAT|nr:unnamed protein product [Protopolystoma xenopodis]